MSAEPKAISDPTLCGPPLSEVEGIGALTLGSFLLEVCEQHADRELLVFYEPSGERHSWRYCDLLEAARALARAMVAGGIGKGTRVGILMGSRPECVATIFGVALAGGVAVPLSTMATAEELAFLLRHADIHTLFTQCRLGDKHTPLETVRQALPGLARGESDQAFPYLQAVVALGLDQSSGALHPWEDYLHRGNAIPNGFIEARNAEVAPSDLGLIIYSSGTTAQPKGMMHVHRAPTLQAWQQARIFCRTPQTRIWTTFPLFWTAGFNTVLGATMAAGGCWVMEELFEPGAAISLIQSEQVSEPYALPHHTNAMEEHSDWAAADFSAVRFISARSPFNRHPSVTNRDPDWHGVWAYGASETCAISVTHRANTPPAVSSASTGRVLAGNLLRVVDTNTGALLGADEEGELCIKGPTLMERYVKANREDCFDSDGFFHTGDSGYYDSDGFVHWTGRLTDMIKSAGANVSPAELKRVIQRVLPTLKISEVVGVPDTTLGQKVVLCAVRQEGDSLSEDEIRATLKTHVAAYKVPRHVLFFEEAEIPMTASGEKVKETELRELAATRLAAGPQ